MTTTALQTHVALVFENDFPLSEQWVFDNDKTIRFLAVVLSALPTWSRMFSWVTRHKATLIEGQICVNSTCLGAVRVPSTSKRQRVLVSKDGPPMSSVFCRWTDFMCNLNWQVYPRSCPRRESDRDSGTTSCRLSASSSSQRHLLICYSSATPRFGVRTAHSPASLLIL